MLQILRRRPVVVALAVVAVFVLWLAFRPELLFVNKHVDDPFPTAGATSYRAGPRPRGALLRVAVRTAALSFLLRVDR